MAGPLAVPQSLSQVGVPVEAMQPAGAAENPQNPEKIALSEELFSDSLAGSKHATAPLERSGDS